MNRDVRPKMSLNPYHSPTTGEDAAQRTHWFNLTIVLAAAATIIVVGNYATSTAAPGFDPSLFTDIVFCTFPLAVVVIARIVATNCLRGWQLLAVTWTWLLVINLALVVALCPCFLRQSDPVLAFVSSNYFFGAYGIYPWIWWVLCGLLPLALLARRETLRWRLVISLGVLSGYAHNGWATWVLSHSNIGT